MSDLNNILEDLEPEVQEQEPETEQAEEAPETEEVEAKTAEEPEEKGAKEEAQKEPPSDLADEVRGLLAATKAERERRQEAERRYEEMRKQLEEKSQEPMPSVFEDEEKFVSSIRNEVSKTVLNERLNVSEAYARDKFGSEKVDQAFEEFKQMTSDSPEVYQRVMSSPLPWLAMVDAVEKHQELQAMKDVDSYKAKLRAEVEAELRKELEAKQQEQEKLRSSVPTSLVDEPSKGSLKGSEWSGPPPLETLLES